MARTLALAAALLCTTTTLHAQLDIDFEKEQIKTVPVADGVYMLAGPGGNIGVSVGEDCVFLIDDQFAPMNEKILAAVQKLSEKPVAFVFNTHWHPDHVGGNEPLGKSGSLIVAHDKVRERLTTDQLIEYYQAKIPAIPPAGLPVVTFSDSVTFHLNGDEIHAVHVPPAHTDGDAIIQFRKANVLHTGDIFATGMFTFFDTSSGGNLDGMIHATEVGLQMADEKTRIIPGHGELATRADLVAYHDMLVEVRRRIQALVQDGVSVEDAVARKPLADLDGEWASQYLNGDAFVRLVYMGLGKTGGP